ncbi:MAG: peroxiredoxin family protein, partial [Planctomycetota bacterium]
PLSEEEVQQYRQIRRQSSSTSEEDDSEKPPRTLHRHSAKRLLKKMEMVGEDAPDFEVKALDGSSLSPADYQGRTLLLHFWSTSTESSRQQVEDMESVYRDYHEEGLEIVGLSLDEDRESLESFVSDSEIQWKQVLLNGNEQQEIPNLYGVDSIPQAVLIGPRGQVRACGRSLLGRGLERNVQSVLGSSHQ